MASEEAEEKLYLPTPRKAESFRRSWITNGSLRTATFARKSASERWGATVEQTGHMGSGDTLEELMDYLGGV